MAAWQWRRPFVSQRSFAVARLVAVPPEGGGASRRPKRPSLSMRRQAGLSDLWEGQGTTGTRRRLIVHAGHRHLAPPAECENRASVVCSPGVNGPRGPLMLSSSQCQARGPQ
ncbi:hypothetical protein E2C01_074419 [Portunus trituberculatus]|uniref:Uncharacterized protein n=1 Tax=Portunus trituberculatus TaxID=210409 RepID=A0A5B7ID46_PORTR|nr:hypothetical protein [Portunus trituberculatus]